jgi:tRNA pseudouridine38-40 synthase
VSRTYHYYIAQHKNPFHQGDAYYLYGDLNIAKMQAAADELLHCTDFTSFSKLHTQVKTNNCKVAYAEWEQVSPLKWQFTITADRFLRNMVRAIVGTLLDVGRGVLTIEQFREIIEKKDRCSAGMSVPGHALFLADITYPDNLFDL